MGRRLALLVAYDGSAFGGSQWQSNTRTVQGELEQAIGRLTGESVRVAFAGRTDAGVHATGQVAAFTTVAAHTPAIFRRALNALLPDDVVVKDVVEGATTFDPRRQACARRYQYRIWRGEASRPLYRTLEWHVPRALDVAAMRHAAAVLVGEHDFASFGGDPGPGRGTVRRMDVSTVEEDGLRLVFVFRATAFLPHQVRRTVGALVEIGRGRLPPRQFEEWLRRPVSGSAAPAAPPHGLTLAAVSYPESAGLPPWSRRLVEDDENL